MFLQSNEQITIPSHLFYSNRKFTQPQKLQRKVLTSPRTIHYSHTIRMITPFSCNHEEEILSLKNDYEQKIRIKDEEIQELRLKIEKQDGLLNQNGSAKLSQDKQIQNSIALMTDQCKIDKQNKPKKSPLLSILSSHTFQIKLPRLTSMNNLAPTKNDKIQSAMSQIKNTIESLSKLSNIIKKPKKYEFHFEQFSQKQTKSVLESLQTKQSMISEVSNTNTECIEEDHRDIIDTFDPDSSQSSKDTNHFMEQLIKDHKNLKITLIELQEKTKSEMDEMKRYYEGQISRYVEILSLDKDVKQNFRLNSTRTNILPQDEFNESIEDFFKFNESEISNSLCTSMLEDYQVIEEY